MKALGASAALINGFFAAEAAALGAVGSVLGFALGVGAATWIGRANFHAPVAPRLSVFPVVLVGSILVALLAAIVPISLLQRFQPSNILSVERDDQIESRQLTLPGAGRGWRGHPRARQCLPARGMRRLERNRRALRIG